MVEETLYDYLFKVVLVGNSSVGKTSLMNRFTCNSFDESNQKATVGVQFSVATLPLHSGKISKLQIWDTAGQERFRAISNAYYRGAHAILIVFDMTDKKSFDDVHYWLQEVKQHHEFAATPTQFPTDEDIFDDQTIKAPLVFLLGNKSDMTEQRKVTSEEAQLAAQQLSMIYKETSAKIGSGVHDAFLQIATLLEGRTNTRISIEMAKERYIIKESTTIKLHNQGELNELDHESHEINDQCKCYCVELTEKVLKKMYNSAKKKNRKFVSPEKIP